MEEGPRGAAHMHRIYFIPKTYTYALNSKTYIDTKVSTYLAFYTNCYPLILAYSYPGLGVIGSPLELPSPEELVPTTKPRKSTN